MMDKWFNKVVQLNCNGLAWMGKFFWHGCCWRPQESVSVKDGRFVDEEVDDWRSTLRGMRRRQLNFFPIFWKVFVVWWCLVLLLLFQCLLIVERAVWIMCMLFVLPVFSWLLDSQILNSIFEWKYNVLLFVQSKTVKKTEKFKHSIIVLSPHFAFPSVIPRQRESYIYY